MKTTNHSILMIILTLIMVPEKISATTSNKFLSLQFFSATLQEDNTVMTEWETNDDMAFTCFVLQHSADGFVFDTLGVVIPESFNPGKVKYNHLHSSPSEGMNFYRLVQIDISGGSHYSLVATVEIEKTKPGKIEILSAFPVPAENELNLNVECQEKTELEVTIVGSIGKVLYSQKYQCVQGTNTIKLSAENLVSGNQYTIVIADDSGAKKHRRFIKR